MSQGVEIEGKNLVVFVVDDNKKTKSEEVLSSNVASSDKVNGQGVNADLSHSLKQCTLSQ